MKILVTGSAGFLGHALCMRLHGAGHSVYGLDRRERPAGATYEQRQVDVCDRGALVALLDDLQPDYVVHCAARIDIDPAARVIEYPANIDGVANLIHAVSLVPGIRRVIWTSSQLVSRIGGARASMTEYDPDNTYGDSKVITEKLVRALDGGGREWVLIRPTTVWGPGMSDHYRTLIRYLDRGRYFHVGSKPVFKSFSYIHNATFQIEKLLFAPAEMVAGRTFYIADYEAIDLRDWCNRLAGALGRAKPPTMPLALARFLARVGDVLAGSLWPGFKFTTFRLKNITTEYVFDMQPLAEVAGPLPVNIDRAIDETIQWFRGAPSREAGR